MSTATNPIAVAQPRALPAIFWGGLIGGAIDITYACTFTVIRGGTAQRVLQFVASGVLGQDSFQMGWQSAAFGLLCHFTIAFGAAVTYYLASRKLRFLIESGRLWGVIFGVGIFYFMEFVVVPLSNAPPYHPKGAALYLGLLVHMFGIGTPIAWSVRKYAS